MNDLTVVIDDKDKIAIGNELTRLFALQDMPLGKEKKAILIEELAAQGLPVDAIISGISSLVREDLKAIKFTTLVDAAHKKMATEEAPMSDCKKCLRGEVFMRDEKKREFALACVCSQGAHVAMVAGLARWNGEETQFRRGRMLTLIPPLVLASHLAEQ